MPSKRTPRRPRPKRVITAAAISLFEQLRLIEDENSDQWGEIHGRLHTELRCRPWEWPCVSNPAAENPYPPGSFAAEQAQRRREQRPGAVELWRELEQAAAASQPKPAKKPRVRS